MPTYKYIMYIPTLSLSFSLFTCNCIYLSVNHLVYLSSISLISLSLSLSSFSLSLSLSLSPLSLSLSFFLSVSLSFSLFLSLTLSLSISFFSYCLSLTPPPPPLFFSQLMTLIYLDTVCLIPCRFRPSDWAISRHLVVTTPSSYAGAFPAK